MSELSIYLLPLNLVEMIKDWNLQVVITYEFIRCHLNVLINRIAGIISAIKIT